ncbi:MAG: adenylate kinase [Candidatus Bathyarchaeota archaeon]|nr:adenylate kinase [Candidatus Bathyarchaeota archaeon]
MRIVILGPPGSGKGTRAQIISKIYGIPVITTGDMLREAAAQDTESGRIADFYMKKGELVPDDIVVEVVEERLGRPDVEGGFILDGFPRNLAQARALDRILKKKGVSIDAVLKIDASTDSIIKRLSLRRSCPRCGAVYHLKYNPPRKDEVCDECGSRLIQRDDDKEDIILYRMIVYEEQTRPILERYENMGKVRELNGEIEIDEIPREVRRVLGDLA